MSGIKVTPGGLGDAMKGIIQEYTDEVVHYLPDAVKEAAKVTVKSLKSSAPSKSGKYKSSFRSKTTESSGQSTTEVYSTKPGLPHLLEYGHVVKNKRGVYGVTRAFPHWAPAEETGADKLEELIRKKAEEAG